MNFLELKEIFNLYDEELDGKIDGTQIGDVVRAAGLKPTNAMVVKASGAEYKRKGEKRITFEEWLPIYEQLSKEKVIILIMFLHHIFLSIRSYILCFLLFSISVFKHSFQKIIIHCFF